MATHSGLDSIDRRPPDLIGSIIPASVPPPPFCNLRRTEYRVRFHTCALPPLHQQLCCVRQFDTSCISPSYSRNLSAASNLPHTGRLAITSRPGLTLVHSTVHSPSFSIPFDLLGPIFHPLLPPFPPLPLHQRPWFFFAQTLPATWPVYLPALPSFCDLPRAVCFPPVAP